MRVPNVLQNLLGEGVLSASFIPIYSGLLEEGRREEAGSFAGAIFGLMAGGGGRPSPCSASCWPGRSSSCSRRASCGDAAAVAAGKMAVDRFALAVTGVRILFPMTGLLVLSVWALAILNSNRRFFLPYFAPVLWNSAIIARADVRRPLARRPRPQDAAGQVQLFKAACWGASRAGCCSSSSSSRVVLRILRGFRPSLSLSVPGVREALAAWWPAVAGRGVVQLAGYIDLFLASLARHRRRLGGPLRADVLSAADQPLRHLGGGLGAAGDVAPARRGDGAGAARPRPARAALRGLPEHPHGDRLSRLRLPGGRLLPRAATSALAENWLVYLVLCGYSTGILATTTSRLLQNTFYALGDTRSPARIAAIRVGTSVAGGAAPDVPARPLSGSISVVGPLPGRTLYLGSVGLALASGFGAWMELYQLRAALRRRLPEFELPWRRTPAWRCWRSRRRCRARSSGGCCRRCRPIFKALLVLGTYGLSYLILAKLARIEEVESLLAGVRRRLRAMRWP